MLKKIFTIILLGTFASHSFSQGTSTISKELESYQKMKKEGKLPFNYEFTNPQILFQPTIKDVESEASNTNKPPGSCGCYATPDATYTLAMGPNDDGSTTSLAIPFNFCLY
ncbi:MAG: hypothetical protein JKX68_00150, partial [Flavobacteriales bacterium]|nr:hypothetical protein [Flavobacteriales bacterium]